MIQKYISQDQQSIYDVCLNTYGSLNLLIKLMTDNNYPSLDNYPPSRSLFVYDDTLTVNQSTRATSGTLQPYATRNTGIGIVNYIITEQGVPASIYVPVPVAAQAVYTGIIDDGIHYDNNFIDSY